MMDITIFTIIPLPAPDQLSLQGQARGKQGVLSVHKNEKITSTHTKIKFPITVIYIFFSMMDIQNFLDWGVGGGAGVNFFSRILFIFLLFHQCNNINTTYQQFMLLFTLVFGT